MIAARQPLLTHVRRMLLPLVLNYHSTYLLGVVAAAVTDLNSNELSVNGNKIGASNLVDRTAD